MIIVFCASVGVGAISIVGSMTTGNWRPGWCSQPASAVTVTCSSRAAASQRIRCATFGLQEKPYGDHTSRRESVMNGAGITSTGGPPAPTRENTICPPRRCQGTRPPPTLIV